TQAAAARAPTGWGWSLSPRAGGRVELPSSPCPVARPAAGSVLQARWVPSSVPLAATRKGRGLSSLVARRARRQVMTGGFEFFAPRLDGFLTAEQMNRQPTRRSSPRSGGGHDRRVARGGHQDLAPGRGAAATAAGRHPSLVRWA